MTDDARLQTLVRQHAKTAQLLGVDFVPAYRTTADAADPAAPASPQEQQSPAARPEPVRPQPVQPEPARAPRPAAESPRVEPARAEAPAPVSDAGTAKPNAARPAAVSGGLVAIPEEKTAEGNLAALEALRARYEADAPHQHFDTKFNKIVFGEGDPAARICFVGEAPGEDEDLSGRPFIGRAGQLLEKMIVAMGLRREDVYICNVLKTRPPGNRTPTTDEVAACKPYLLEQLAIVRPEAVVGLGLSATHALLEVTDAMSRLRGRWWELMDARGRAVPFMPTYHPAFLLRSYTEENRAKVWSDLKMVMERLGMAGKKPV